MLYNEPVPNTTTTNDDALTPATGLAVTIECIEGSTERHERFRGTSHRPADFEAILAGIAQNAPAAGAYDKTTVTLRWRAGRVSGLAAPGTPLKLELRLDVTRDFGSLAAYLAAVGERYAYVALHGRLPERECPWLTADQAREAADFYEEALAAYAGTMAGESWGTLPN